MKEEELAGFRNGFGNFPGARSVSNVGVREPGVNLLRPEAAEAVKRVKRLPVRPNGIFKHPSTWTEEEDNVIIELLRAKVPLHIIALKVNAERNSLSKHIKNTPELAQLAADMREAVIDNAEYMADRLVTAGNPTMIMFMLERLGKSRGWGAVDVENNDGADNRIVMGVIPEDDVKGADEFIERVAPDREKNSVFVGDPVKMAQIEEKVIAEAEAENAQRESEYSSANADAIEAEAVEEGREEVSSGDVLTEAESLFDMDGDSPFGGF